MRSPVQLRSWAPYRSCIGSAGPIAIVAKCLFPSPVIRPVSGKTVAVKGFRYQAEKESMSKAKFERKKPHVNVGTIGHVDHGKT
ncbi:hypothetical protein F2Q65_16115, partial [Thiohalocapsa marina]